MYRDCINFILSFILSSLFTPAAPFPLIHCQSTPPKRCSWAYNDVITRLPLAADDTDLATMTSPAAVNLSAWPLHFHRRKHCLWPNAYKKYLLLTRFCDLSPTADPLKMMTTHLGLFDVTSISSIFIYFPQIVLRPTYLFLLVPPIKILNTSHRPPPTIAIYHFCYIRWDNAVYASSVNTPGWGAA